MAGKLPRAPAPARRGRSEFASWRASACKTDRSLLGNVTYRPPHGRYGNFVIAYCPTNIYSVGTVHEIALSRLERKPVLFVSPPIEFPSYDALAKHLVKDAVGTHLLNELKAELPIKPNERGIPSLWYMPLVEARAFSTGLVSNFQSTENAMAGKIPPSTRWSAGARQFAHCCRSWKR